MARSYNGITVESKSLLARLADMGTRLRTYAVTTTCERRHCRDAVEAVSPDAAALAFVEAWCADQDETVTVQVTDCETGRGHCFRLEYDSSEAEPCH